MALRIVIAVLALAPGTLAEDPSATQNAQEMMDFIKWQRTQSVNLDASKKEESKTESKQASTATGSSEQQARMGGPVSGGSGFQKYMDFSKYMGAGGTSATGSGSPGAGTGFQQYMDFSKYMGAGGASATGGGSPGAGAGFQQYMDFSKYMGAGGTSATGSGSPDAGAGFQKYMDYSKYMGAGGASNPAAGPTNLASTGGGASEDYMSKYMGKDWDSFQDHMNAYQNVPFSAAECKTVEELMLWRQKQLDTAHNFIPGAYQGFVVGQVEKDTKQNLKRLESEKKEQNATAPVASVASVASAISVPTDSKAIEPQEKMTQALEQLAKDRAAFEKSKEDFIKLQASVKQASVKLERPRQQMETLASNEPSGHFSKIIALFACLCAASAAIVGLALVPSLTRRFQSQSAGGLYMPLQEELPLSTEEPTSFFERLRQHFSPAKDEEAPVAWSVPGTNDDLVV